MIVYNREALSHLSILQQAWEAFQDKLIRQDELDNIRARYPKYFYTPNFFIRVGLFILTAVILLFSFGLLTLVFLSAIENAIGGLVVFFALLTYAVLEYMVQTKRHLQSGVDDALLWISAGSFFGGISFLSNAGDLANCVLLFLIAGYCSLRFADRLMCIIAYISLLGIFFFTCTWLGPIAKSIIPFLMMAIAAVVYWASRKAGRSAGNLLYSNSLEVVAVAALVSFYLSGNYYVVRELSNAMFDLRLAEGVPIPLAWLFWILTLGIPCLYILKGIQLKDRLLIRVGLVLVAAMVFTARYYYAFASIEMLMTLAGLFLMLVAYTVTRYLRTPKLGFCNEERVSGDIAGGKQLESLLQAQTLTTPAVVDGTRFGGGSFGGGGASAEF